MSVFLLGTSGYSYQDWRGVFYPKGVPQKDWLRFYAQHFNAVEINATFYRSFPEKVYARWRDATPDSFRFVLKAPRTITHEKALESIEPELEQLTANTAVLGNKLDALLWQFPASVHLVELEGRLAHFLPILPKTIRHIFEFRHQSWFSESVYVLLNQFHAGLVINDSPRFPSHNVTTGNMLYVRFHGPGKLYDSLYSHEQLKKWTQRISPYLNQQRVYLFFNNTTRGQALDNANALRQMLSAARK